MNLSRSGLGFSFGVRGARVSTGPRGTYVHVGAGGFRYSRRLGSAPGDRRASPSPATISPGPGSVVEVLDPGRIVDSSADELLEEIRRKQGRLSFSPLLAVVAAIGLLVFLLGRESPARSPLP